MCSVHCKLVKGMSSSFISKPLHLGLLEEKTHFLSDHQMFSVCGFVRLVSDCYNNLVVMSWTFIKPLGG